jgi:predicted alpha/beta-fold hydrolase
LTRSRRLVPCRRETWETPDGDELVLDRIDGAVFGSPRLLVLHGLEGSSESVYVQGLMALARARGWSGVALNFRSCARTPEDHDVWIPNRRPRLYHSGETTDLAFVLSRLAGEAEADPSAAGPLVVAGVSLGGNVLLKWLGENPDQRTVAAAAAISVPFDLGAGGRHMESGFGPFYTRHLLSTLTVKAEDLAARFPEAGARLDLPRLRRARTFFEFDDAGTAPLHGFAGARDYYERSSSLGFVGRIATPVLAISAADDPFLPASVLDSVARAKSSAVELLVTRRGGHAGFVGGTIRPRYWAEERAVAWLAERLSPPGRRNEP